jgi:hypothetical protein
LRYAKDIPHFEEYEVFGINLAQHTLSTLMNEFLEYTNLRMFWDVEDQKRSGVTFDETAKLKGVRPSSK